MTGFDHGLSERTLDTLASLFGKYSGIRRAVLYGSRAAGAARDASDIDVTLFTDGAFTESDLIRLYGDLDDSDIPYAVDISMYDNLRDSGLRRHIQSAGKVLFAREQEEAQR
ncbi:MAG: nucleotidyltransferase domain-containing protein [Synergistaceae bacterium]|jgi:predicted nucleotidyltransferase|nr:nucleotidyltransferase domain-containing protein [Synergistaceae bacterium]